MDYQCFFHLLAVRSELLSSAFASPALGSFAIFPSSVIRGITGGGSGIVCGIVPAFLLVLGGLALEPVPSLFGPLLESVTGISLGFQNFRS